MPTNCLPLGRVSGTADVLAGEACWICEIFGLGTILHDTTPPALSTNPNG